MNERAANAVHRPDLPGTLLPIWHLDPGRALFMGALGHNALHAHSVPVLLAGLYDALRLRIGDGPWQRCAAAAIPAGVSYEFDVEGQPLAVLYLEPQAGRIDALAPFVTKTTETSGALLGGSSIVAALREIYEARNGAAWAAEALDDLLAYSAPRARRAMDPRIAHALSDLEVETGLDATAQCAATRVGLSSSRFQHLFADEVGVPFRRFRVWQRLRRAIGEIIDGSNFTDAAHAAGFADQAHFSRAFRQAFGASASPSLRKVRSAAA
ncbi:helix-turn-helix domain-containing protein [Hyphomicrobium sp.]|uniref:AraC family transcriptional regulator n=1 Tax=Hyphomicrobium sp. TaxID=82 RepID=UPI003F72450A